MTIGPRTMSHTSRPPLFIALKRLNLVTGIADSAILDVTNKSPEVAGLITAEQ